LTRSCFIGVDLGTSGCRAVAIDRARRPLAWARARLAEPLRVGDGGVEQDPQLWWDAMTHVLREVGRRVAPATPQALCVDGTSSTLLLCGTDGTPLAPALMYNDLRSRDEARYVARAAPDASPARGAGSSLSKLLHLERRLSPEAGTRAMHQADWLLGRLTGCFRASDWNNCLKLGYDPQTERWPDWLAKLDLERVGLPDVTAPGATIGRVTRAAAAATGLPEGMRVAAGTTDSTAAVIAAGAAAPGQAVTCLGSTLVLKVVGEGPVTAPEYGVYSHRFGHRWLIGGASNSGGAVLRRFFDDARIQVLTARLRPDRPTGLDYYPLPADGERFPFNDPEMQPRLNPRPDDDLRFFQGLLEGIAGIEAAGYRRLVALGAPAPTLVSTIGGGAGNRGWTRIRARMLGVPVMPAGFQEAAYGSAVLALVGGVPG
jgi:sugar (pentulose or hexulose) kinase